MHCTNLHQPRFGHLECARANARKTRKWRRRLVDKVWLSQICSWQKSKCISSQSKFTADVGRVAGLQINRAICNIHEPRCVLIRNHSSFKGPKFKSTASATARQNASRTKTQYHIKTLFEHFAKDMTKLAHLSSVNHGVRYETFCRDVCLSWLSRTTIPRHFAPR